MWGRKGNARGGPKRAPEGWGLAEAVGPRFLGSALASWPLAAGAGIWAPRPARRTVWAGLAASLEIHSPRSCVFLVYFSCFVWFAFHKKAASE